jgi:hypothetical protein
VIFLLILLVLLNLADAVLTFFLVEFNLATEGNFFMAHFMGEPAFFIVKILGSLLAAYILWDIARRHRKLGVIATSCAVGVYAIVVIWNASIFFINPAVFVN